MPIGTWTSGATAKATAAAGAGQTFRTSIRIGGTFGAGKTSRSVLSGTSPHIYHKGEVMLITLTGLLLDLPRFSLEALPTILLIVLIIVLFAVLLWFLLSKVPEPIGSWARWIAIVIGGILLLWFLISLV